jgi:L-histidine N-alpha-methyltransferase
LQLAEISAGSRYIDGFQDAVGMRTNVFIRTNWRAEPVMEFAASVASGLSKTPKELECRFLYDARGSELYERITEQPEYYPARTEASILACSAGEIRRITGPVTILELGSGSSCKTHSLLEPYQRKCAQAGRGRNGAPPRASAGGKRPRDL